MQPLQPLCLSDIVITEAKGSKIILTFAENTVSPFTFALYFLVASLTNLSAKSLVPTPFPLISDSLGHTDRETENTCEGKTTEKHHRQTTL